jgi:hypothetical protein
MGAGAQGGQSKKGFSFPQKEAHPIDALIPTYRDSPLPVRKSEQGSLSLPAVSFISHTGRIQFQSSLLVTADADGA